MTAYNVLLILTLLVAVLVAYVLGLAQGRGNDSDGGDRDDLPPIDWPSFDTQRDSWDRNPTEGVHR